MQFFESATYKNVMELLVEEEIAKQLDQYPPEQVSEVNQIEVATYALNRLYPLYASSQEGVIYQKQRAQKQFHQQLKAVVKKGLQVIPKKPVRMSTPLLPVEEVEAEVQMARMTLQEFTEPVPTSTQTVTASP